MPGLPRDTSVVLAASEMTGPFTSHQLLVPQPHARQRRNAAYLSVQHLHLKYVTFTWLEFDSTKLSYF